MARTYYVEVFNGFLKYSYDTTLSSSLREAKATAKGILTDLQRAYPDLKAYEDADADEKSYDISVTVYETRKTDCDVDVKFYVLA